MNVHKIEAIVILMGFLLISLALTWLGVHVMMRSQREIMKGIKNRSKYTSPDWLKQQRGYLWDGWFVLAVIFIISLIIDIPLLKYLIIAFTI